MNLSIFFRRLGWAPWTALLASSLAFTCLLWLSACGEPMAHEQDAHDEHDSLEHEHAESAAGELRIAADMAQLHDVRIAEAGAGRIEQGLWLYGRLRANPERTRAVTARYRGQVRRVSVQLGASVSEGQALATVEADDSLQIYTVNAPMAGVITARRANPGEATGDAPLFEIADFSSLWAELPVFPRDLQAGLGDGMPVRIRAALRDHEVEARIASVLPAISGASSALARVTLDNGDGRWIPGEFVEAWVTSQSLSLPLVVPLSALQIHDGQDVVFAAEGEAYRAVPVKLGRRDVQRVEVVDGLQVGTRIVVGNSYLLRAELEKFGAEHAH